ncbi:hypothetical protein Godav_013501, partial [Gossypium davidsonii]|nr:hypothetical protein [Gossypium davidsonii]
GFKNAPWLNFWPIATFGTSKCHWSFLQRPRCTNPTSHALVRVYTTYSADLHKIDLWGRLEEDWPTFYKKYIKMWEHRYDFLPTPKPFLTPELATSPDYMGWFRHNDKLYLLPTLEKGRQHRCRRPRRRPINFRSEDGDMAGSTSALEDLIVMQPSSGSSSQPPTQSGGIHNGQLGHDRSQTWRKEMNQ